MRPLELDIELFDRLADESGADLITILIPTHKTGRDVVQDPIQLKNQLSVVDDHLETLGWKPRQRSERLAAARELLDDREFWEHQYDGLALYIYDDGGVTPVSVPVGVAASWYVGQVFHLRHLVPSMGLARVPILTLTQKAVRLFVGSKLEMEEIEADIPESIDDVNWFVDREKQRQQHPDRAGASGNRHGHEPSARADEDRDRFLRAVASVVDDVVPNGPLVVLGDGDIVERFRRVVDLETVSPESSGVSRPADDSVIHELAKQAISRIEAAAEAAALKEAMDRLGVGRATSSIAEALPAAVSGRVGSVVVGRETAPVWGRLDATDLSVDVHDEMRHGDVDLVDRLVVESHKTSATVTTVGEQVEGDGFVASFRY